jgi:hypothetical protein
MSVQYTFTTRYIYTSNDHSEISKHYDKIKEHITNLIRIDKNNNSRIFVNIMLVKIVYEIISEGYSPYTYFNDEYLLSKLTLIRLDDIINKAIQWLDRNKLCKCNIFNICSNSLEPEYNRNIIYSILKYYILDYGIIPKCRFLSLSYQYYLQEKKVGNMQEIHDYEMLLNEIEMDPEEFHNKYKHKLPTQNLSKLISKNMDSIIVKNKEPCCGICQYDIEENQKYYELPCGHLFHENDQDCLEFATIIFWLKDNKFCPICKKEVIL